MARLDETRRAPRSTMTARRWATAGVLAILMVPVLVMMPSSNGSVAFAEVQAYFNDFRTMSARMTTKMNGDVVLTMDIVVDAQDRVRLDSGDQFSFIIDPNRQVMLQLFHPQQIAVRVPIQDDDSAASAPALDWLAEIREYQGQSRLIEEVRTIDDEAVLGFRLTDRAVDMTLWATEQGRPVLLEMETGPEGAAATTEIRFSFDQPLDPDRISLAVPQGYSLSAEVDDD
ncbi:LolA family protein [Wenzhouxiangella sp. EGI_FJ10409]|uniref:LolA family protein n=1 Tax=Wenzhouxiangella sp. EGI_FJ10409 TaxID=3243767 RepID=UPI0035DB580C